ncbi:endonuclease IV [Thermoplasma volcanium GSS1]|uniref:Probable endonuclease 4 n=1 Tax=Thermoplasma volcanium (strain ATCC 51530 / DSM 4299 / JCM 9571 / NBRC 15438 / GSS1) TaxID=273116 RepID=END4_THEVO|nr:deoxyribonuclease IV [Thermoplasma volcanium]Q97A09.1 RecName: Full=Probable endonuclease 4; AltName: Full=Endodeoxyribonuclease IV; AltName: Full=Endonuclease IV [Thermoplasma volcanium GSS1]BAB60143.1 endonuclease IV [Thermoplasma volcanium GSS1]
MDDDLKSIASKYYIGGHISVSGGLHLAPERASIFGFRTFQFFSKNQMRWNSTPISEEEALRFISEVSSHSISSTMVHASYLINLASSSNELHQKSFNAFVEEIQRAERIDATFLTFHPGSNGNKDEGIRKIKEAIEKVETHKVKLLVENTAGQGNVIGSTIYEIGQIIDGFDSSVGVCIDTCHAWAAGYDITNKYDEFIDELDSAIGLDRIYAFHLNDAMKDLGSNIDRHELIGRGKIGEGLIKLISDVRLFGKPKIMETPYGEAKFEENLKYIRKKLGE